MGTNDASSVEGWLPPKGQQCNKEKVFHCRKRRHPALRGWFTRLEGDFSSHNFDTMAANADVIYDAAIQVGPDEDLAGTFHFQTLLDEDALVGCGHTVGRHPGGSASCGRARGWVFAVVEDHAGVETRAGVHGFARNEG